MCVRLGLGLWVALVIVLWRRRWLLLWDSWIRIHEFRNNLLGFWLCTIILDWSNDWSSVLISRVNYCSVWIWVLIWNHLALALRVRIYLTGLLGQSCGRWYRLGSLPLE